MLDVQEFAIYVHKEPTTADNRTQYRLQRHK
jgi:hypothetical protein